MKITNEQQALINYLFGEDKEVMMKDDDGYFDDDNSKNETQWAVRWIADKEDEEDKYEIHDSREAVQKIVSMFGSSAEVVSRIISTTYGEWTVSVSAEQEVKLLKYELAKCRIIIASLKKKDPNNDW